MATDSSTASPVTPDDSHDKLGQFITFGIPSLDELLGRPIKGHANDKTFDTSQEGCFGIYLEPRKQSTSLCLIGPDGTGKSVLALHLAAQYAATGIDKTRILYASTDLSFGKTVTTWVNFALGDPIARRLAIETILPPGRVRYESSRIPKNFRVWIERYLPLIPGDAKIEGRGDDSDENAFKGRPLPGYLIDSPRREVKGVKVKRRDGGQEVIEEIDETRHYIGFIDLESSTAGDDWGMINRLLATLETPKPHEPRHLLIIDAVEGLEAFGGQQDAFGHLRERRSRIAQILRAAKEKCHVVFVVEEPKDNERLPEQFVSDVVIRLRVERPDRFAGSYARRTLEIEKQRGQSYVRGRHDCFIRRGTGSRTGTNETKFNPDDLPYEVDNIVPVDSPDPAGRTTKSYFFVLPSLHYISRELMESHGTSSPDRRLNRNTNQDKGLCGTGIAYLDDMIGGMRQIDPDSYDTYLHHSDLNGFPWGSISSLIGDEGTHKSRLGRAFLAQTFRDEDGDIDPSRGIALLLTTHDLDDQRLAEKFAHHHGQNEPTPGLDTRIYCRRIEYHHLTSAELFHIISSLVEAGLRALRKSDRGDQPEDKDEPKDPVNPGRVRFVIDDWGSIREAHPEIRDDPLFLPFLLFYLRRRGITVLLIDTQPGRPSHVLVDESDRVLRASVDHHLYTWYVNFFGEKRVAIAALPPVDEKQPFTVRELDGTGDGESLQVDPNFELYTGFAEDQAPRLIPLKVDLFTVDREPNAYHDDVASVFKAVFSAEAEVRLSGANASGGDYDQLRSQAYLRGKQSFEHTQVLQIDEFWSNERETLEDLTKYLLARTLDSKGQPNVFEDPALMFQPSADMKSDDPTSERWMRFKTIGYSVNKNLMPLGDRVPYLLDFGFLLAREDHWDKAIKKGDGESEKIKRIWDALSDDPRPTNHFGKKLDKIETVSWREFLGACLSVAKHAEGSTTAPVAFDVDLSTVESFSCLALEIIASELRSLGNRGTALADELFPTSRNESSDDELPPQFGLFHLVGATNPNVPLDSIGRMALFRAWLLLSSALSGPLPRDGFEWKARRASTNAVASRHWYSTACPAFQEEPNLTPLRNAGSHTVRGDWYLAIASGSRSRRLGERAIDILTSRRANITRMHLGLGLPTRGFVDNLSPFDDWADTEFRSPLKVRFERGGAHSGSRHLLFHDLLRLGGTPSLDRVFEGNNPDFFWLWRSRLQNYDRHSRIWRKWLLYALDNLNNPRSPKFDQFKSLTDSQACLALYDKLLEAGDDWRNDKVLAPVAAGFDRLCEVLRVALQRATIRTDPPEE